MTAIDPTSPGPHVPLGKRFWNAFVTFLTKRNVPMGIFVLITIVTAGAVWVLFDGQADTNQRATEQIIYQSQVDAYQIAVDAWNSDVAALTLCLDGVDRSDKNRGQWELLTEILRDPKTALDAYAEALEQGPLLASPPRDPADCPQPGDAPIPPTPP